MWEHSINDTNIFLQIKNGTDVVRERAIKYLHLKLKTEGGQLLNKDSEITLFKEIKGCVTVSLHRAENVKRRKMRHFNFFFFLGLLCSRIPAIYVYVEPYIHP